MLAGKLQAAASHRIGPRMAARIASRFILTRRQREGLSWSVVACTGGRVRDLPGNLLSDECNDQPGVDPCSCEVEIFGRQLVEPSQALEPLESQLDLPTKTIDREDVGRREEAGRQRGQEQD